MWECLVSFCQIAECYFFLRKILSTERDANHGASQSSMMVFRLDSTETLNVALIITAILCRKQMTANALPILIDALMSGQGFRCRENIYMQSKCIPRRCLIEFCDMSTRQEKCWILILTKSCFTSLS